MTSATEQVRSDRDAIRNDFNIAKGDVRYVKEATVEKVGAVRGYFQKKAEAARTRKAALISNLKARKSYAMNSIKLGAESAGDNALRAAKIGGNVLMLSGVVAVGVGVIAAKGAVNVAKSGINQARTVGEETILNAQKAHAEVTVRRANRAGYTALKNTEKSTALHAKAEAMQANLEARTSSN